MLNLRAALDNLEFPGTDAAAHGVGAGRRPHVEPVARTPTLRP